jgi:hypothetical protein
MSKLRLQAEVARRDAETRYKKFNELVEQTTMQVKSKEKEAESARAKLLSLEGSLKVTCTDLLGKNIFFFFPST